jgi:hydrogenase-4 transcriptional activator
MENFQKILLKLWQNAGRQIEIHQSCADISQLLTPYLPLSRVVLRRYDAVRQQLETVAVGLLNAGELPEGRTPLSFQQWRRLETQFAKTPVIRCTAAEVSRLVFPQETDADFNVLAGRLGFGGSFSGLLLFIAQQGKTFSPPHRKMMEALLEPFSVALENDQRLRELAALREAAEADKKSLLQRFYRQTLEDTVVGAEHGLARVMERVELVARSDVPVLILGETGTGKELISREIHRRSLCAAGPFIRVNCGAIPSELIDSQLFGHEKGAFTGAVTAHQGWFERAHKGTLFLDEIGELSQAAQVRLLRILQDGWLERVGAKQPIHVEVRVVVATNRDLAEMVRRGRFREDLWYRLAVFPILLPALWERTEDIPALARHFAERAAIRFGLPPQLPTVEDIELLKRYRWPGNIRELSSVIDRAAILGNGKGLEIRKALGSFDDNTISAKNESTAAESAVFLSLDVVIRRHIEAALKQCGGRVEGARGAAALLQIHPNTLRARMRKLVIAWQKFRL